MSELRLLASLRRRGNGRLDAWCDPAPADPSIAEVVAAANGGPSAAGWLVSGGEPTLREDLPELLRALSDAGAPRLGLVSDGLALASERAARDLASFGLRRLRVGFHCARSDAHDWLVGLPGAARRAVRSMRAAAAAGLELEAEIVVTRPTMPYLEETVLVLARYGVRAVHFELFTPRRGSASDAIALTPRLGLLAPYVEAAVAAAGSSGLRAVLHDFPASAAGNAVELRAVEQWVEPLHRSWTGVAARFRPQSDGAPADYVEQFGWTELDSSATDHPGAEEVATVGVPSGPVPPPPRAGRAPATRVAFAIRQAARGALDADPLRGVPARPLPLSIRVAFGGPSRVACPNCGDAGAREPEPTRAIRIRLSKVAQEGARTLRVASAASVAHPEAGDLLRETTKLSFPRVEVAGECSALDELPEGELGRLRRLSRVDVALYGPDRDRHDAHAGRPGAFDAALRGARRLHDLTGVPVGSFAVLHDADPVLDYAAAWDERALPGEPAFRLSARGGSLNALADVARRLSPGLVRDALAAVLPPCLLTRGPALQPAAAAESGERSGSDRLGAYRACPHEGDCAAADRCPGLAEGWSAFGVEAIA